MFDFSKGYLAPKSRISGVLKFKLNFIVVSRNNKKLLKLALN